MSQSHHPHRLHHNQFGQPECFVAEWHDSIGAGSRCLFSNLDAAIFFVVSGIGRDIDWSCFPDPARSYPFEDRDGSNPGLNPVFCIEQGKVSGSVTRMAISDSWTVGNGIAEFSKQAFCAATGRNVVRLVGEGDKLTGRV
jgi:hypothetical protein